jgi:FkbH-like protein
MNASAQLYTANEVVDLLDSCSHHVLIASMSDRFGEYGTVAVALALEIQETLRIDGLWMSCRVAKRGLPPCVFTSLADLAYDLELTSLEVVYRSTGFNRLALFHLSQYGFRFVEDNSNSDHRLLRISIPEERRPYPTWIKVSRW